MKRSFLLILLLLLVPVWAGATTYYLRAPTISYSVGPTMAKVQFSLREVV